MASHRVAEKAGFIFVAEAIKFGAIKFHICAGSSEEAIAFYRILGCVDAEKINEEFYEGDSCDIQLEYPFSNRIHL